MDLKVTWHKCWYWWDVVSHGRITVGRHRGQQSIIGQNYVCQQKSSITNELCSVYQ